MNTEIFLLLVGILLSGSFVLFLNMNTRSLFIRGMTLLFVYIAIILAFALVIWRTLLYFG